MFAWNKKTVRDIEFVDVSRKAYLSYPIVPAKDIKPLAHSHQIAKYGKFLFPHCPGIIDYSQMGYIVPAWIDMHIKVNKAGAVYGLGSDQRGQRGYRPPSRMNPDVVDGFIGLEDGIDLTVLKFDSPWNVLVSEGISALALPAFYHSNFLDDLHVWPGNVDYKNFTALNFICSPKKECEIHIKAGDPLLHIIPFWNKKMIAGYGPGTDLQIDKTKNNIPGDDKQFYRKYLQVKKMFGMEKKDEI